MPQTVRTIEIVLVDLVDLYVPDWNPRKYLDEAELADLMAYMKSGNPIPPLALWQDPLSEKLSILEGQRRYVAAQRLGWTQLEAERVDCTLDQAKTRAITSNRGSRPYWLDEYESWMARFADHTEWVKNKDKAWHLGVDPSWVSRCEGIMKVLNQASKELIRGVLAKKTENDKKILEGRSESLESLQELAGDWVVKEDVAHRLAAFLLDNRPVMTAQSLAYKALQEIIAKRLNGPQASQVVKMIIQREKGENPSADSPIVSGQVADSSKASGPRHQTEGHGLIVPVSKETGAPGPKKNAGEVSVFWGTMAGIPWIKAIRAKINSGQDLTLWEKLFLVAAFFGRILHWLWHTTWPLAKKFIGLVGRNLKRALNSILSERGQSSFINILSVAPIETTSPFPRAVLSTSSPNA